MLSLKGFKRTFQNYKQQLVLKLKNIKATPYEIASGCACGVAISFTPFVGFHLVLATITAFTIRGNVVASWLGTVAGNPWTFALIWPATLYTGREILGLEHEPETDFAKIFDNFFHSAVNFDFKAMQIDVWPIIYPMMIGSIPFYIAVWCLSYYFIKKNLLKINY
ncbi:MAG: DUF2062 domain-containing protein [Alphaproteobacteria bacterium]|nr:DUF2062 domain-containing protein [Alphaproteobacteria bacterium]